VNKLALLAPSECFAGMNMSYRMRALPLFVAPSKRRARAFLRWETGDRELNTAWVEVMTTGAALRWSKIVLPRRPAAGQLRSLHCPTLVVLPEHDRSQNNRRVRDKARELLPQVRVVELAGATHHTVPVEDGAQLAEEIERFLGPP
jgi:pimeloyl-ACP methyl ester carboxylesterase